MATKTLSIITPVWNQSQFTRDYLTQSYRHYFDRDDLEWIVVNNGSTDNTAITLIQFQYQFNGNLMYLYNSDNVGFSAACNQGVKVATGEYLLFLNNDVRIYGDYITPLLASLGEKVLVGAELLSHNTGWNQFGDLPPIQYIPGWCLAMSKATFEALGGFDEQYSPADYEDMDLCYNAVQRGYSLIPLRLPIDHISGQSGVQLPQRRIITERNRAKFAEKWGLVCAV